MLIENPKTLNEWKLKFVQIGGFDHLLQTFINLQIESIESKLTLKCIESLL